MALDVSLAREPGPLAVKGRGEATLVNLLDVEQSFTFTITCSRAPSSPSGCRVVDVRATTRGAGSSPARQDDVIQPSGRPNCRSALAIRWRMGLSALPMDR
jgi:hypothetical protein